MNLTQHINDLQYQLKVAAEAGGEESRAAAERLIAPLESAARLVLLEALSAAASEITLELAPGSVDVRLRGRDPEFVVTPPIGPVLESIREFRAESLPVPALDGADDRGASRITLRLPDHLKQRIEDVAGREGLSVNTWIARTLAAALEPKDRRDERSGGSRYTGWVR